MPEVRAAVEKVGLRWEDFTLTDNTCKPPESRLEEAEADLVFVETRVASGLSTASRELGRDALLLENILVKDAQIVEKSLEPASLEADLEEGGLRIASAFGRLKARVQFPGKLPEFKEYSPARLESLEQ